MKNPYGIEVKEWCASCRYKEMTRALSFRRCTVTGRRVDPHHVCSRWRMSDLLCAMGQPEFTNKLKKEV